MYKYILKRLVLMIPIVLGVSIIIFFLISIVPGDPATIILQGNATAEDVARLNHELGYDLPIIVRYFNYMKGLILHGDFGKSYVSGLPVLQELLSKAPISAMVAMNAIVFASVIGVPLGVLSAVKQYSLADKIPTFFALVFSSAPAFWIGLMLMQIFSLKLGLLPTGGIETLKSYILPMLTLGTPYAAEQLRFTRSSMLETIRQDYIRTARAKGAKESRVIWKHAMRNALLPVITVSGVNFGALMGGAVVTETLFSLPGIASYIVNGIKQKDVPVVMGGIIFFAIVFAFVMLLVDLIYAFVDPRIKAKYSGRRN